MTTRDLARLFRPQSVAVVGASDDPQRIGGRVLRNLLAHGYRGRVIPVSRRSATVQGLDALASVEELGAPVDLAVLAVNATGTLDVMKKLLDGGTRHFLSFAAGADSQAISEVLARCDGATLVGPNSNGIWSVGERLIVSFGSEAEADEIIDGPVAVVAHSGSLGGAIARRLQQEGIGTRYLVSAGNEASLSLVDYIDYFLTDPTIRVIGTYIEGVTDGSRLRGALYRARESGVQVVALLAGQSRSARAATASHTGKALSSAELYRAVLEDCGVAVVNSTTALSRACRLATAGFGPVAPRVGAVGISGGMLAIIANACEGAGLDFPSLGPRTSSRLEQALPGFSRPVNPVDLTGAVLERGGLLPECARAVAEDPGIDALVVGLDNKGYERVCSGDWIEGLAGEVKKPIALVLWDEPLDRRLDLERKLLDSGVAIVPDPAETAATLRWMCRSSHVGGGGIPPVPQSSPRFTQAQLQTWDGQAEFATFLELRLPHSVVVGDDWGDHNVFAGLTPPLVAKALPNRAQHKTDRGLVLTDLVSLEAAGQAVLALRRLTDVPIVVQEQVRGVEVLLAMSVDADWGPVLTLGVGGSMVELIGEFVSLPAPCEPDSIEAALARGRLSPLLRGFRGSPPADIAAVVRAAERLQHTFLSSELDEVELNPILVGPPGIGAVMVDLLTSGPR